MMTAIEPAPLSCSAVTGSPARCVADDDPTQPSTQVRPSDVASARMAITSEAAVMSKPVWRDDAVLLARRGRR